jgi:hypothetical protein
VADLSPLATLSTLLFLSSADQRVIATDVVVNVPVANPLRSLAGAEVPATAQCVDASCVQLVYSVVGSGVETPWSAQLAADDFTYLFSGVLVRDVVEAPPTGTAPSVVGDPPDGIVDGTFYYEFTIAGVPAPTVRLASGSLPPGLVLDRFGVLSGTPTASGTYTFTVQASNGIGPDASQEVSLTISLKAISPGGSNPGTLTPGIDLAATGAGTSAIAFGCAGAVLLGTMLAIGAALQNRRESQTR